MSRLPFGAAIAAALTLAKIRVSAVHLSLFTLAFCLSLFLGASAAFAHAHLDHASPPVGSTVAEAPKAISLWFTEKLEPAFSTAEVYDSSGARVDLGSTVDSSDATVLRAKLKPLPPGIYKVVWRVVSVDTHTTNGDFTFRVTGK